MGKAAEIVKDGYLWSEVSQTVRKIKPSEQAARPIKKTKITVRLRRSELTLPNVSRETLVKGDVKAMDASTAARFSKGKMKIDGRLDLHGYTIDAAYMKLRDFIASSYVRGARCVIVVTGKGKVKEDEAGRLNLMSGALREQFPRWLNQKDIRPYVVSFTAANDKDGGEGAFYIYLKRQREK